MVDIEEISKCQDNRFSYFNDIWSKLRQWREKQLRNKFGYNHGYFQFCNRDLTSS